MRIYNRKDFMNLPIGTFYCKIDSGSGGGLCIKKESLYNDWYYQDLCNIESFDSQERWDFIDDSLQNGTSYEISSSEMRDGFYENEDKFLVYEKKDLELLKKYIEEAMSK